METLRAGTDDATKLADLVRSTFADSEGEDEGGLIGALAADLMATTAKDYLYTFSAWDGDEVIGAIFFSRMHYAGDTRHVFVLAPVAVATDRQGEGIGQRLLRHGLDVLRADGVDVALTYGDPNYYGKVGYRPITVEDVPAPHPLKFPHGWLGQSLTDRPLGRFAGPARCVAALDRPDFW